MKKMDKTERKEFVAYLMGYRTPLKTSGGHKYTSGGVDGDKLATSERLAPGLLKVLALTEEDIADRIGKPIVEDIFLEAAYIVTDTYITAQIKEPDGYNIGCYSLSDGKLFTGITTNGSTFTTVKIGEHFRNGTPLLMALMQHLRKENPLVARSYEVLKELAKDDACTIMDFLIQAAKMSELVYETLLAEQTKLNIDVETKDGDKYFKPSSITQGNLRVHTSNQIDVYGKPADFIGKELILGKLKMKQVRGKYAYGKQSFTKEQLARIPVLDDAMSVSREAYDTARKIMVSTDSKMPIRVIALTGPAGTGKTVMAKQIAAMLNRPYRVCNGSPDMERFDVIAQLMPTVSTINDKAEKVSSKFEIPSIEETLFDPEGVYEAITGESAPVGYTTEECLVLREKMLKEQIVREANKDGNDFQMVLSEIVTALRDGEVVEFMEADLIRQAGVLASLNNILDINSGVGVLPNGETFKVNKDAVVIFTMNLDLEGCNALNQSFIDRLQMMVHVDTPQKSVVVERVLEQTDCTNKKFVEQCVDVMERMKTECKDQGITDGVCGVRSVISWVQTAWLNEKLGIANPAQTAAVDTIINKATMDQEQRDIFFEAYIKDTKFMSPMGEEK